MLYSILVVLIVIICALLTLVVLLQNGDGSGMNAMMGGASTQMMGSRRTSDILSKSTAILGAAFLILCVIANFAIDKGGNTGSSAVQSALPGMSTIPTDFSQPTESAPAVPTDNSDTPANDK